MALQALHRLQGRGGAHQQLAAAQIPEVARGQSGQQRKAHVGRRGAVRDARDWMLLHVVGRQVVVRRADMGLEKRPGAAREPAQESGLRAVQRRMLAAQRAVYPPHQQWRQEPQHQNRCGYGQHRGPQQRQADAAGDGEHRAEGHSTRAVQQVLQAARRRCGAHIGGWAPLQQPPLGQQNAPQGARDGTQAVGRLVGQAGQSLHGLQQQVLHLAADGRRGTRRFFVAPALQWSAQPACQMGAEGHQADDGQHIEGPAPGLRHPGPPGEQHQQQRGGCQAAPQVVEDLGARQPRQRIGRRIGQRMQTPAQPANQLPIAAYPAVAARHVGAVARGRVLEQLHLAEQTGACVAALEQVVAQDAVLGHAVAQRAFENIDIVDAFADKRAFAEQVLIDIGDRPRIGVDASLAAVQPGVAAAVGAGQTQGHAGLQDAVALDHDVALRAAAEARPVQRVRHGGDKMRGRVARQLRIGVQRDHITHGRQHERIADDAVEALAGTCTGTTTQQRIQVGELAAFALLTHPDAFALVPTARAVEKKEVVIALGVGRHAVLRIQRRDAHGGEFDQRRIGRQMLLRCVVQIGEQAEMQSRISVGEKPHLERVDQFLNACAAAEHGWHDHQRARLQGDAECVVHARQGPRRDDQGHEPVDDRHHELAAGDQQQHGQCGQTPPRPLQVRVHLKQRSSAERQAAKHDAA